jgi:predicted transcriptional regulator
VQCGMLREKIVAFLEKKKEPCTQKEIAVALSGINRAVLLGYLRCLVDVGKIKSKDSGKAKVYYL